MGSETCTRHVGKPRADNSIHYRRRTPPVRGTERNERNCYGARFRMLQGSSTTERRWSCALGPGSVGTTILRPVGTLLAWSASESPAWVAPTMSIPAHFTIQPSVNSVSASCQSASFSGQIKILRQRYGRKQWWLAHVAGCSDAAVSYWESGKRIPAAGRLARIVDALLLEGASLDDIAQLRRSWADEKVFRNENQRLAVNRIRPTRSVSRQLAGGAGIG